MKVVSMTMVGNEALTIESFIRYTCLFVDEMWLISCCSVDNSLKIIRNLMQEGLPIHLVLDEEYRISYDQKIVENKYLNLISKQTKADWILPLDVDEFLSAKCNPREILKTLKDDCLYICNWKNYAITHDDDPSKCFIPSKLKYVKNNYSGNEYTKVVIPGKRVFSNQIYVSTGHHYAWGNDMKCLILENLWISHFPVVDENQYKLKIYGNSISFIAWSNRGDGEGQHINLQRALMNEENLYCLANGYGLDEQTKIDVTYDPMNMNWCESDLLKMKYTDLAIVELEKTIVKIGQLMAIKAYINERKLAQKDDTRPEILLYGAGQASNRLFDSINTNCVDVLAYVDADTMKEFTMKQKRLVIGLDWIRFFEYDKIVITSEKFFPEIKRNLEKMGVPTEKIVNQSYLIQLNW